MIGDLHFIRPWWLLAVLPLAVLWWALRRQHDDARPWKQIVAPHLLPVLLQGSQATRRRWWASPLTFIAVSWALAVVAIAGPTWRREPAPFADDVAPLAIVVRVTPSMLTEDVQPSRLARGVQKIHDLLDQRKGAKTALVAYAGTAHVVMPLTTDGGIIDTFAQSLDPKIMPHGDADAAGDALALADTALGGSGSILWIADGVAAEQTTLARWRTASRTPVRLLPPLLPGSELDALATAVKMTDARIVDLTPDDADVTSLARAAKFATAVTSSQSDRWEEAGYWLTPVLLAIALPFFRKGWMLPTAAKA